MRNRVGSASADTPKPVVAASDMDMSNAFATGQNPDNAVVCVTTGLLRRLEPAELEGVLAHELSHVAHKDVAVITVASFLGVIAGLVVRFAFYSQLFSGGRGDQNTGVVFSAVMDVSAVVYMVSFLLIRALSRYAEARDAIEAEAGRLRSWVGPTRVTPRFRTPLERELAYA